MVAGVSVLERLGLIFAFTAGMILTAFSALSAVVDFLRFDIFSVEIDMVFLCIGVIICIFCVKTYKKTMYYAKLADSAFEEGIYKRLEPVLRKFAEIYVQMGDIESRLDLIDKKVETVIEENVSRNPSLTSEHMVPGTSVSFAVKAIFAAIITVGGFFFMLQTFIPGTEYAVLLFYIIWWILITQEFSLLREESTMLLSLIALFIPILTVPVGFILVNAFIIFLRDSGILSIPTGGAGNITTSIFYILLAVYAVAYYSSAVRAKYGVSPIDIKKVFLMKR